MSHEKILLAVLAHPDDESFGMGGTLAVYAAQGVQVHLVCATRGEVGQADEEHLQGYASVAAMREAELRCAAGILGLAGVHFLDYRDSGMPGSPDNAHPNALTAQPVEVVAGKVAGLMRKIKPQVVLTFDPIGGYRHPDHIAIQQATVRAVELAADAEFLPGEDKPYQPQRLYFHTIPRGFIKFAVRLLRLFGKDPSRWGTNGDIDLASLADVDFPTHARIDIRPVLDKKEQASICHSSQGGGQMRRGFTGWVLRLFGTSETFMRARPSVSVDERLERDLFVDVVYES
ncbi:MAG: PIG-L deacetylase family protein [Chloroflexota bacterium]